MTQFLIPQTESIICIMQRVLSDGFLNKWKLRKLLNFCELRFGQQGYIAKNGNLLQIIYLFIKQPHHSLWYMTMRCILMRAKGFDLELCFFCPLAISICIHPPNHLMFLLPDCFTSTDASWEVFFESGKSIITVIAKILFDCPPRKTQWNFGRKMHMWPVASIISCMRDFCSKHSRCMPACQRSLSLSTCLIPFRALGNFRWSDRKILG